MEKSAAGVGAGAGLDPPPQEIIARQKRKLEHRPSAFEEGPISTLPAEEQDLRPRLFLPAAIRQIEGTPVFSDDLSRSCLLLIEVEALSLFKLKPGAQA
jgi:hypothetical protein